MMLPFVLGELPPNVEIVVGNGTHRPPTQEEIKKILGCSRKYAWNDAKGKDFVWAGTTSRGTPVGVKRAYMEADVKVLLGDVEYHFFAGYGGGRKSILPGISSYETIQHNPQAHVPSPIGYWSVIG
jgi:nickel-dependent lactate racemase